MNHGSRLYCSLKYSISHVSGKLEKSKILFYFCNHSSLLLYLLSYSSIMIANIFQLRHF